MERRGQDRDYNPPESPVKLPLAPIVSTPPERRGVNATLSTRRGSAIFSPTQTLDHHLLHHHHHHHRHHPPPLKDPSPDPDPDPSSPRPEGTPNSSSPASPPQPQAPPPQLQVPPPPPPQPEASNNHSGSTTSVRYRECLKNHAASMGGHVVDGCGEFMPNGEEGTVEALRCAACDCHRNFHRKEVDGETQPSNVYQMNPNSGSRTPLLNSHTPPLVPAHQQQHNHKHPFSHSRGFAAAAPAMVSFGGHSGGGADESSSEDLNMFQANAGGHAVMQASSRKRFRTKFSQEQKDRMQELAEKLGWRIQKQDEQEVQQLCNETGVKRQVFKVWMHNNKQAMKKRQL